MYMSSSQGTDVEKDQDLLDDIVLHKFKILA